MQKGHERVKKKSESGGREEGWGKNFRGKKEGRTLEEIVLWGKKVENLRKELKEKQGGPEKKSPSRRKLSGLRGGEKVAGKS